MGNSVPRVYLAVELGASSGRVCSGAFDGSRLWVQDVRRFPIPMESGAGSMRPDLPALFEEVKRGLALAARAHGPCIRSLGVESAMEGGPTEPGRDRSLPNLFNSWLSGREVQDHAPQTRNSSAGPGLDLGEVQLDVARQTGLRSVRVVNVSTEGEASDVIANLLVQMLADGAIANLEEGREVVRRSVPPDAPSGAHSG